MDIILVVILCRPSKFEGLASIIKPEVRYYRFKIIQKREKKLAISGMILFTLIFSCRGSHFVFVSVKAEVLQTNVFTFGDN